MNTSAMTLLSDAVENLHTTFSPYRIGDDFIECNDCAAPSATDSKKLAEKSLRLLTHEDMERYARKAMTTWGDVSHFKHFLPRLLELTIKHRDEFCDLAVVFGKLSYAQWHSWPKREFGAVDGFLRAYWEFQLGQEIASPQDDAIDTVLCAEASAYQSIQPLLDTWLATNLITGRKHLAAFVLWNWDYLIRKQRLMNPFWNHESKAYSEVLTWLRSDEVFAYLNDVELPGGFEAASYQLEAVRAVLGLSPE